MKLWSDTTTILHSRRDRNQLLLIKKYTKTFIEGFLQVVVKLAAAGVNPVETYIRSGNYARKPSLPYIPGTDAAGTVESVSEGVQNVKVLNMLILCWITTSVAKVL